MIEIHYYPANAMVDEARKRRLPYFESREAVEVEKKEREAIDRIMTRRIRKLCAPEIDDYVNCIVDRTFTFLLCKPLCRKMKRCLKEYETPEQLTKMRRQIAKERVEDGTSLLRLKGRAMYNKYFEYGQDTILESFVGDAIPAQNWPARET